MARSDSRNAFAGNLLLLLLSSGVAAAPSGIRAEQNGIPPTLQHRRLAAEAGDLRAALDLAEAYELGIGVRRDADEALRWRKAAAELGDAESAYRLGNHAAAGQGGSRDDVLARRWYRLAAEKGHAPAQLELSKLLGAAGATDADIQESERWYERALIAGAVRLPKPGPAGDLGQEPVGPTLTDLREAARLKRLHARSAPAFRGVGPLSPVPGAWPVTPGIVTTPGSLIPGTPALPGTLWLWLPGTPWPWPGTVR